MKLRFLYRGLKARFRDQRAEIRAIVGALGPNDVAVDVGANKGSYLWSMSRAVPGGQVVAFEPQPVLADYLKRVCKTVGLTNVVVNAAGVSRQGGSLVLAIPGQGDSSPSASFEPAVQAAESCRTITVPVFALDDYFEKEKRKIGAIKIDVEGHELSVLQGAKGILESHAPLVVCEIESRHVAQGDVGTVLDYFRSLSYDGFFVHRSRMIPISEFKPEVHQAEIGDRYWDLPNYCNNFVMRKLAG